MRFLPTLLLVAIALSGCGGVPQDHNFTVADDAPSKTDAYKGDGYDLRVRVVDENGTPIQGAAVVMFTMSDSFGGSASATEDGGRVVAWWEAEFTTYETVAGLRTNAEGWVEADLQPNSHIHVGAGDVDGMTTEVRANVALNGGGQSGAITIPLYPETVTYSMPVVFGNHAGSAGVMQGQHEAYKIPFSDDAERGMAYADRVYSLEASTTWTNDLQQGADLHIAIGSDTSMHWTGADKQQYVNDGSHTEKVIVTSIDLDGYRSDLAARGYHAHLITDWVALSFDGLDATIDVTAQLKGSNISINNN